MAQARPCQAMGRVAQRVVSQMFVSHQAIIHAHLTTIPPRHVLEVAHMILQNYAD
jgi:hypothetical protein